MFRVYLLNSARSVGVTLKKEIVANPGKLYRDVNASIVDRIVCNDERANQISKPDNHQKRKYYERTKKIKDKPNYTNDIFK